MTFALTNILNGDFVGLPQTYYDKYYDLSQVSKCEKTCLPGLVTTKQR